MASVSLKNVSKLYSQNVHAVKDVNLDVKDKEFLVIVGPSGCGKTTILRMIAGLEEATSGDILIGDRRVNDVSPKDRDIAMVFQNYALYPHMNVYENMAFGLKLRKFQKQEIDRRVHEAGRLLGIDQLLRRKPKELSGGQRQRVAMGRAIVREPKVFLMDEPLSNLDAQFRVQMRAELQKLHRRLGITTIYVTHDQTEAMTLGSRIAIVKDGLIQQIDTPLSLYEKPANRFVAGFIGSPSMNFVSAKIFSKADKTYVKTGSFEIEMPKEKGEKLASCKDKEFIFGIRPEDIYDKMFAQLATPENTLEAVVDVFEPMGSEVYLYVTIGEETLVARMNANTQAGVGSKIQIVLDMGKMHAFDKESGVSLF